MNTIETSKTGCVVLALETTFTTFTSAHIIFAEWQCFPRTLDFTSRLFGVPLKFWPFTTEGYTTPVREFTHDRDDLADFNPSTSHVVGVTLTDIYVH